MCGVFWEIVCTCFPLNNFLEKSRGMSSSSSSSSMDAEVLKLLREINGNLEKIVNRQPIDCDAARAVKESRAMTDQYGTGWSVGFMARSL